MLFLGQNYGGLTLNLDNCPISSGDFHAICLGFQGRQTGEQTRPLGIKKLCKLNHDVVFWARPPGGLTLTINLDDFSKNTRSF